MSTGAEQDVELVCPLSTRAELVYEKGGSAVNVLNPRKWSAGCRGWPARTSRSPRCPHAADLEDLSLVSPRGSHITSAAIEIFIIHDCFARCADTAKENTAKNTNTAVDDLPQSSIVGLGEGLE